MKRLKIILQHNIIYYVFLFICIILYVVFNNLDYVSVYEEFDKEEFIITNITEKDYGIKLELKGKENVLGNMYLETNEMDSFLKKYFLGDKVLVSGEISYITDNTVPNTFNYKKYLFSNEIYNVIEINYIEKISSNKNVFYRLKSFLINRGERLEKSYPYINSLIFGNNSYLDSDVLSSYRENGVSHLFAISGMHISIFLLFLNFFLNRFNFNEVFRSFILIIFLLFYMFLTNFSMSVMRGGIFTILLILNKIFKFEISSLNLLILALCIILCMNPLNLNNVGLLYSFLVTFFLICFSKIIKGNYICKLFIISLLAFFVSYPISINNFNQVNFFSILYNMVFVPYVSFLLIPFVFIGYIFPLLDSVIFCLVTIIEKVSQFLVDIDIGKVSMCKMNVSMIVIYYVVLCLILKCKKKKRLIFSFILIFFFTLHYFMPFKSEDYVIFFDVGQGDSSLLSVNDTFTLIDTGGVVMYGDKEYTYNLSKNLLIPYFKSNGIRKLNNLVLTHGDADHMKEAKYLVENFKVEKVIFNCGEFNHLEHELIEVLDKKNIQYDSCIKELNIRNDKLYFLNDKIYDDENENDNSIVIYTKLNNRKILLMGDAGVDVEQDILENYNLKDIDILKVGHHGSKTSSSKEFIDKINPKYSIISAGKNNRYGHPNDEVLDNLKESKIYRTDEDGSIMFKFKNNELRIENCSP